VQLSLTNNQIGDAGAAELAKALAAHHTLVEVCCVPHGATPMVARGDFAWWSDRMVERERSARWLTATVAVKCLVQLNLSTNNISAAGAAELAAALASNQTLIDV